MIFLKGGVKFVNEQKMYQINPLHNVCVCVCVCVCVGGGGGGGGGGPTSTLNFGGGCNTL